MRSWLRGSIEGCADCATVFPTDPDQLQNTCISYNYQLNREHDDTRRVDKSISHHVLVVLCNPCWCLNGEAPISKIADTNDLQPSFCEALKPPSNPTTTPSPPQSPVTKAAMLSRQVFRSARAAAPQRALLRATPARSYAAAAAASEVQVPVAVFGVDGTYATALVRPSPPLLSDVLPPEVPIGAIRRCTLCWRIARRGLERSLTVASISSTRRPSSHRASTPRPRPSPTWARCSRRTPGCQACCRRRR